MKITFVFTVFLVLLGAMLIAANSKEQQQQEAAAQGFCICTEELHPVCGENGKTYGNRCRLNCEGVKLDHNGQCKGDVIWEN